MTTENFDKDEFMSSLEWSDRFFNYVPAEQATGDYYKGKADELKEVLRPMAKQFKEVNECPFSEEWLVNDFIGRI